MFFVYMLISKDKHKHTYVGSTKNLKIRLNLHNSGKGAKFCRGRTWKLIYKKSFKTKSESLKFEYSLKKNYKLRKKIKLKFLN